MKRLVCLLLLALAVIGCARTVSTASDTVFVELTLRFRGNVNMSNTLIVIPISTETTTIQPVNAAIDDYFIFPGLEYDDSTLATVIENVSGYYDDVFSTWSSFVYLSGTGSSSIDYYESGGAFFSINEDGDHFDFIESLSFEVVDATSSGDELSLVFDIAQLNFVESDVMQFSLLIFEKESGSGSGFYRDTILSTDDAVTFTLNRNSSTDTQTLDSNDVLLDANHDLIEWSIQAY